MTWTVTEVDAPHCFTWKSHSAGVSAVARHILSAQRDGTTKVDLALEQTGPLARLAGLLTGRLTERYLRTEAEGLRRAIEQPREAPWRGGSEVSEGGSWSRSQATSTVRGPMNAALWIDAGLLAGVFLLSSSAKLLVPKEKLATVPLGGWTADASVGFVKGLGVLEALAAAGLILPGGFDIAPVLVPLDAVGIELLMVGAMATHLRRHEPLGVALNLAYMTMAGFLAWGRFGRRTFRDVRPERDHPGQK